MIPYQVLVYLLTTTGQLREVREFLVKRFNTPERIEKFQKQLDHMIANLETFGYVSCDGEGDRVTVNDSVNRLTGFRSVDPLYSVFMAERLVRASFEEKLQALESVLPAPPALRRKTALPDDLEPGPLQTQVLQPELLKRGLLVIDEDGQYVGASEEEYEDYYWEEAARKRPATFPEMLKMLFDSELASPEDVEVRAQWIAGGIMQAADDFYKYVQNRELIKHEGIVLRHLLRLVLLAEEFHVHSGGDPDYARIGERITGVCTQVDPRYTDHFLAEQKQVEVSSPLR